MNIIDRFVEEHRELHRLGVELERCAIARGRGYENAARELFRFFFNHGRAEEYVFDQMLKKIRSSPAIADLKGEHVAIVNSSFGLKKALEEAAHEPDRLIGQTHLFLQLLHTHTAREERLVFPEARRVLDPAVLGVIGKALERQ